MLHQHTLILMMMSPPSDYLAIQVTAPYLLVQFLSLVTPPFLGHLGEMLCTCNYIQVLLVAYPPIIITYPLLIPAPVVRLPSRVAAQLKHPFYVHILGRLCGAG